MDSPSSCCSSLDDFVITPAIPLSYSHTNSPALAHQELSDRLIKSAAKFHHATTAGPTSEVPSADLSKLTIKSADTSVASEGPALLASNQPEILTVADNLNAVVGSTAQAPGDSVTSTMIAKVENAYTADPESPMSVAHIDDMITVNGVKYVRDKCSVTNSQDNETSGECSVQFGQGLRGCYDQVQKFAAIEWDGPVIPTDPHSALQSPVVEVRVGIKERVFYIHQDILTRYLGDCKYGEHQKGITEKVVRLPTDTARPLEIIIRTLYSGNPYHLAIADWEDNSFLLEIYILATKYGHFGICDELLKRLDLTESVSSFMQEAKFVYDHHPADQRFRTFFKSHLLDQIECTAAGKVHTGWGDAAILSPEEIASMVHEGGQFAIDVADVLLKTFVTPPKVETVSEWRKPEAKHCDLWGFPLTPGTGLVLPVKNEISAQVPAGHCWGAPIEDDDRNYGWDAPAPPSLPWNGSGESVPPTPAMNAPGLGGTIVMESAAPQAYTKSQCGRAAVALMDSEIRGPHALFFRAGDVITMITGYPSSTGIDGFGRVYTLTGSCRGYYGSFPSNFVQPLNPLHPASHLDLERLMHAPDVCGSETADQVEWYEEWNEE